MKRMMVLLLVFFALSLNVHSQESCTSPDVNQNCYFYNGEVIFEPNADASHLCYKEDACQIRFSPYKDFSTEIAYSYKCMRETDGTGFLHEGSSHWVGPFVDEECTISGTQLFSDSDVDGVPNDFDKCTQTMTYFSERNMVDDNGCPAELDENGDPILLEESLCKHIGGSGNNANIIFYPCGFQADSGSGFAAWSSAISDMFLNEIVPFSSNNDKFSMYLLFETDLANVDTDFCADYRETALEKIRSACSPMLKGTEDNIIIGLISHNQDQASGAALRSDKYEIFYGLATISEGVTNSGERIVGTLLTAAHEIGHTFRLGHSYGTTDINDYYIFNDPNLPDTETRKFWMIYSDDYYYPGYDFQKKIYSDEPCAIWNLDIYPIWGTFLEEGESIGCYPGYNNFKKYYSPQIAINSDIMTAHGINLASGFVKKYNPIQRVLIKEALDYGYQSRASGLSKNNLPEIKCDYAFYDRNNQIKCFTEACRHVAEDVKDACCKGQQLDENKFPGLDPEAPLEVYEGCRKNLGLS